MAILDLISQAHLPSSVNMLARYLKHFTFSSCFCSILIVTGIGFLEILITFIFSTFWWDYKATNDTTTKPARVWKELVVASFIACTSTSRESVVIRLRDRNRWNVTVVPRGPTQPPVEWVPVLSSRMQGGRDVKVTTHVHLAPKLKTRAALTSVPRAFVAGTATTFRICLENPKNVWIRLRNK